MSKLEVRPVTIGHWADLQAVLMGGGDGKSCQCMWPVLSSREWRDTTVDERRAMLKTEVGAASPGLVAYDEATPVGWVRVGPRPPQRRIVASRIVASGSAEALDDSSVWAVSCFSVRREHRGSGVVHDLLDGAIRHARAAGARVLEGYPFDLDVGERSPNSLFVGALSTFEAAGFSVVGRPTPARVVVALDL